MNINKINTNSETYEEMQYFFENEGFIQLTDFFENDIKIIKSKIENSNSKKIHFSKIERWKEINFKENYDLDIIKLIEFLKSKEFIKFLENITQFELQITNINCSMYELGDFRELNDKIKSKEDSIEVYFDMSDEIEEEMGGTLVYTSKDEEIFYLNPMFNTMTILYKSTEIMKYLEKINSKAKNRKIVRVEMRLEQADSLID